MKMLAAILVYLVLGLMLAFGIYLAVFGKLWLLILGFIVYLLAFAKFGCLSH